MERNKIKSEILLSSLKTFSENENHKQKLFIQFFLGVFIVIVGYSIVYSDMEKDADIWEFKRKGSYYVITSYSISALIGAYTIAQCVLILLSRIIVSGGYNFRKYQMVAHTIRKEFLGKEYKKFYGDRDFEFTPYNKNGSFSTNSYLPEFDTVFFVCIWLLQVLLFFSIIFKLGTFNDPDFQKIAEPVTIFRIFDTNFYAIRFWIILILFIPLVLTAIFQKNYYFKYLDKVREKIPKFIKGQLNYEFKKNENYRNYMRSISLAWGYILLLYVFLTSILFFLILNYYTTVKYLATVDLLIALGIIIFLWLCFAWNFIKAFIHFRKYVGKKKLVRNIVKKYIYECRHNFLKRSNTGKKYRIITPIILFLIILQIFFMSIYIALIRIYYPFLIGFHPMIIFSSVMLIFISISVLILKVKLYKNPTHY